MTRPLPVHVVMGQPVQFLVNQRHQLIARSLVAVSPGGQKFGYIFGRRCHSGSQLECARALKCRRLYTPPRTFHFILEAQTEMKPLLLVRGFEANSRVCW